ncbi:MAG: TIGR04076 family protein [bacterium]
MSQETGFHSGEFEVLAKVISQKGTCAAGHKVGDEILFDGMSVKGKICMSAMYSMLPKVFAMRYGAHFPWLSDPDVATHACPDAQNPVVFEIRRLRTGG